MWEKLKKVIKLIEKSGDKCIILAEENEPIVLMGFNEYEKLSFQRSEVAGLSQDELLDKINREIAVWRTINQETNEINQPVLDFSDKINNNKLKINNENSQNSEDNLKTNSLISEKIKTENNDEYLVEPIE